MPSVKARLPALPLNLAVLELATMASEAMSRQRLRIIDANLNRAGEGVHLLEDIARRVQEALRILEELSKIPGTTPKLDPGRFKQARFELYTIEQKLLSRLLRQDKISKLTGLYAIIDSQALSQRSHIEVARQLIRGGAKIVQLRDKLRSKGELLPIAQELKALCSEHSVLFIMNDYLDLALAADADGLHLGQGDIPISVARRLLPIDKILGCSVNTLEQATAAESGGGD